LYLTVSRAVLFI